MTRLRATAIILTLFGASVLVRQPLFNKELTASHEWLQAHILITLQLWSSVPENVHHFNLIYTFLSPADRFVDNMWSAGVADRSGRYYYVSMPHLAFFTPYAALKSLKLPPSIKSLELFGLGVQFIAAVMLFILIRRLTRDSAGSWLAATAGFCVFLFAPTALYFYQNAVVATVLVIPYTIALLMSVNAILDDGAESRRSSVPWIVLFIAVVGGCLTDWQGYFTALAAFAVALAIALRRRTLRQAAIGIAVVCCSGVVLAMLLTIYQDSRIAGWQPFVDAIFGRLRVRSGGAGQGLTSAFYYRQLLRFYSAYAPFILLTAGLLMVVFRRGHHHLRVFFKPVEIVLAIAVLAVIADHLLLANHTAVHIFTTLNALPAFAICTGVAIVASLRTSNRVQWDSTLVVLALLLCCVASVLEYNYAYRNRPHPFRKAAAAIAAVERPDDVIFATGNGFRMPTDFIVPQMLYYLRRNVMIVGGEEEAHRYLAAHSLRRGVLARINGDFTVAGVDVVNTLK